jgi:hypothetical protein
MPACAIQNGFLKTSDGRVFIAPRGVGCGRGYTYYSCMKATGLSKSVGDITSYFCPDPFRSGRFVEAATIQGEENRWTFTVTGPKPFGSESILRKLLRQSGCEFDLQIHFGRCNDPTDFNGATQIVVAEGVRVSDYSTDDLVALNPGEEAVIAETISLSAREIYEIFQPELFQATEADTADNLMLACVYYPGAISDGCVAGCGEGCVEDCMVYFALGVPFVPSLNGSVVNILYTLNGGIDWSTYTLPCAASAAAALGYYNLVVGGNKLFITLNEVGGNGHIFSVPVDNIINGTSNGNTFFSVNHPITDTFFSGGILWAVGTGGRISAVDTRSYVSVLVEDGSSYPNNWWAIDGCDEDNLIVGGTAGQLAYRANGSSLQRVQLMIGNTQIIDDITSVAQKSRSDWYVVTSRGILYCTTNCGRTWTQTGLFDACVKQIQFATNNIGYIVVGSPPAIYRTSDGGTSWRLINDASQQIPEGTVLFDIAACPTNPNHFVAAGRVTLSGGDLCIADGGMAIEGDSGVLLVGQVG